MHCDIISDFPFISMLEFHKKHGKMATLMSITLDKLDKLSNYGNLVKHSETNGFYFINLFQILFFLF